MTKVWVHKGIESYRWKADSPTARVHSALGPFVRHVLLLLLLLLLVLLLLLMVLLMLLLLLLLFAAHWADTTAAVARQASRLLIFV